MKRYNDYFETDLFLEDFVKANKCYNYLITDADIRFLRELYRRKINSIRKLRNEDKIKSIILVDILYDFLTHFSIEKWYSYKLFAERFNGRLPRRRYKLLFILLPLTRGEYYNALKAGRILGYWRNTPIGKRERKRNFWEVVRNSWRGDKRILERC